MRNKVLWFFGLLVLFVGAKGVDIESAFVYYDALTNVTNPLHPNFWEGGVWSGLVERFGGVGLFVSFVIVVVLVLLLAVSITFAHVALIDAFSRNSHKKEDEMVSHAPYHFSQALTAAKTVLKSAFVTLLIPKFVWLVFIMLHAVLYIAGVKSVLLLFILTFPFVVVLSLISRYALQYVVQEKLGVVEAYGRAAGLLKANWAISLEYAAFMYILYTLLNTAVYLTATVITYPLFIFGIVQYSAMDSSTVYEGNAFLFLGVIFFLTVVSSIIFSAWHMGVWTLLFAQLTKGAKLPKLYTVLQKNKS